jgi:RimJ/RimL family protein N-acetyltransferase
MDSNAVSPVPDSECVNAENVAAKRLYVSQGFQTFGLEPRAMQVNGRFYDEEHMCKPLP